MLGGLTLYTDETSFSTSSKKNYITKGKAGQYSMLTGWNPIWTKKKKNEGKNHIQVIRDPTITISLDIAKVVM